MPKLTKIEKEMGIPLGKATLLERIAQLKRAGYEEAARKLEGNQLLPNPKMWEI